MNFHAHALSINFCSLLHVHRFNLPEGVGLIWLDNINCFGSESRLENCAHNIIGTHDCSHREDVAVSCFGTRIIPSECKYIMYRSSHIVGIPYVCTLSRNGRLFTPTHFEQKGLESISICTTLYLLINCLAWGSKCAGD